MKLPHKIEGHGSMNGRVYMLLTPPDPSARPQRVSITDEAKLNTFFTREFGISPSELLGVTRPR